MQATTISVYKCIIFAEPPETSHIGHKNPQLTKSEVPPYSTSHSFAGLRDGGSEVDPHSVPELSRTCYLPPDMSVSVQLSTPR